MIKSNQSIRNGIWLRCYGIARGVLHFFPQSDRHFRAASSPTYDLLLFVPAFQLLNNIIQDAPKTAQSLCCFIPRVCAETPRLRELSNFFALDFPGWKEEAGGGSGRSAADVKDVISISDRVTRRRRRRRGSADLGYSYGRDEWQPFDIHDPRRNCMSVTPHPRVVRLPFTDPLQPARMKAAQDTLFALPPRWSGRQMESRSAKGKNLYIVETDKWQM